MRAAAVAVATGPGAPGPAPARWYNPHDVWFARGALLLVSCAVSLAAGEGLLRAAGFSYSPVRIGSAVGGDHRAEHAFLDRHLLYDPDLIWRPLSGQFSPFNPQGFRGVPLDAVKPAGAVRIIAIGDSNTFGWSVDEGANWPDQLERRLAATRPGVRVVNAGVWGYSLYQGRRRFEEMLVFDPDVVLISFGANDAHQVTVPDAAYVRNQTRIERLTRLSSRLRLAQLGVATWDRLTATGGSLGPRVPLDDYRRYLHEIITTAKGRRVHVVLLTRPFVGTATDAASWKFHAPAYNAATRQIGQAEGVPVVDVHAAFADSPELFDDESHFGVQGHRKAADLLTAALQPILTTAAGPSVAPD